MQIKELREYQIEFEKIRISISPKFKKLFKLREKFTKDYTIKVISSLNLDEYVTGKGGPSFCNRIENELNAWGNIHGSSAVRLQQKRDKLAFNSETISAPVSMILQLILSGQLIARLFNMTNSSD